MPGSRDNWIEFDSFIYMIDLGLSVIAIFIINEKS